MFKMFKNRKKKETTTMTKVECFKAFREARDNGTLTVTKKVI